MGPLLFGHDSGATTLGPLHWGYYSGATSMEPLLFGHDSGATTRSAAPTLQLWANALGPVTEPWFSSFL